MPDLIQDLRNLPEETRIVKKKRKWEGTLIEDGEEIDKCSAFEFGGVVRSLIILARRNDMFEDST